MSYKFFQNKNCEYFPCHKIKNKDEFNCIFCYCPLYFLNNCKQNYKIINNNIKDCSNCIFPHKKENYDKIINLIIKHNEEQASS